MNQVVRKYRKKVGKKLFCGAAARTRLLEQFDRILSPFLEECQEPNLEELHAAFGAPKQMAQELLQDVPQEERNKWKRRSRVKKAIPYVIIVLLLAACVSIYRCKGQPVMLEEQETIVIERKPTESFEKETEDLLK